MRFFNFLLFTLIYINLNAQSAPITIDGVFDDWTDNLTTYTDVSESISGVDLLEIQVTNDADYLFIKIKANTEFDLTDDTIPQNIGLYIDTDNSDITGYNIQTGYGSELGLLFNQYLAHYNVTPYSQIGFSDFSFRSAPTVTSNEFEIAIKRNAIPDGINPLFPNNTIKILLKNTNNGDNLPNIGTVFTYTFDDTPVTPYIPTELNKENANYIRIASYNTELDGLIATDRLPYFERIVTSINPDIIGFLECWNTSTTQVKTLMDTWLPLGTSDGWYVLQNGTSIIASKWNFLDWWFIIDRQFPVLIDLPNNFSTDLLFTNAHLKCCDSGDALRQDQADQYAAFILDAKTVGGEIDLPQNTPFIYAGDLNLVGSSSPLNTLITGNIQNTATYGDGDSLDWDNTNLTDQNTIQSDVRMAYTWRKDNTQYQPGKLDFLIYSDAVINIKKSFVLQTEVMSSSRLSQYGLNEFDTSNASDHFPIVSDFTINTTAATIHKNLADIISIYPNPVTDIVTIHISDKESYHLKLINIYGKVVLSTAFLNEKSLNIKNLSNGIYIVTITNKNGTSYFSKLIKK